MPHGDFADKDFNSDTVLSLQTLILSDNPADATTPVPGGGIGCYEFVIDPSNVWHIGDEVTPDHEYNNVGLVPQYVCTKVRRLGPMMLRMVLWDGYTNNLPGKIFTTSDPLPSSLFPFIDPVNNPWGNGDKPGSLLHGVDSNGFDAGLSRPILVDFLNEVLNDGVGYYAGYRRCKGRLIRGVLYATGVLNPNDIPKLTSSYTFTTSDYTQPGWGFVGDKYVFGTYHGILYTFSDGTTTISIESFTVP